MQRRSVLFRFNIIGKLLMAVLLLTSVISGCTSLAPVQKQEIHVIVPEPLPSGYGWWYARFRMAWPPDTAPSWHVDLLIAHQVVMPLLEENDDEIPLWRFHRRAARDNHGRQFSFIFYADSQTAQRIFQRLQSDPLLQNLKLAGVIEACIYDNPAEIIRPSIQDTSDQNWPVSIQRTWPYYIMGVSRMWLNLIAEVVKANMEFHSPSSLSEIEKFYQQINSRVSELWEKEGQHVFLHHLNAVFGYEPLIYSEKRRLTF
jgi:hypothetical protein